MGHAYTKLVLHNQIQLEEIDPCLYVDRLCCQLGLGSTTLGNTVRAHATRLIDLAKLDSIVTGRRPYAVSGAAVHIALNANSAHTEVNKEKMRVKHIAQLLHIAQGTIAARVRELKQAMLVKAALLPWGNSVTLKTVENYLSLILSAAEVQKRIISEDTRNTPLVIDGPPSQSFFAENMAMPPSFRNSREARDRRKDKMEAAKKRLIAILRNEPIEDNADSEGLEIEKLLMNGVSEDVIINGYYSAGRHIHNT